MKCSICKNEITHPLIKNYLGNNPFPVRTDDDARCCDDCNSMFVIPARIALLSRDVEPIAKHLNQLSQLQLTEIFC